MRSIFTPLAALLALGAIAGLARPASADISNSVAAALMNTTKQSSYHITMSGPGIGQASGDMQYPSKMRMIMPGQNMEEIIIGDTMYMKMGGKWTKSTGAGAIMDQSDALKKFQAKRLDYTSTDLGMKSVGGVTYHAYALDNAKTKTHQVMYIDSHGLIGRFVVDKMTMTLSNFGANVSIVAPM